jgi:formylglycine-generating enzyme required for sulfatase activity
VPVGRYKAGKSVCGAYDLAGNVWEWVNDWYQADYVYTEYSHPTGPDSGTERSSPLSPVETRR